MLDSQDTAGKGKSTSHSSLFNRHRTPLFSSLESTRKAHETRKDQAPRSAPSSKLKFLSRFRSFRVDFNERTNPPGPAAQRKRATRPTLMRMLHRFPCAPGGRARMRWSPGESARTAKNDVSLKETASIPPPVAHSRVKTQDVPGPRRSTDRRRSIVACPMSRSARDRRRERREPGSWLRGAERRDAQRRERERELISLRPQCMCAQVGREGVGLLVRWSWHVVVDVSLSLSPLSWSAGLYPSFSCVGAQMS